jgi:hypothetical protein
MPQTIEKMNKELDRVLSVGLKGLSPGKHLTVAEDQLALYEQMVKSALPLYGAREEGSIMFLRHSAQLHIEIAKALDG